MTNWISAFAPSSSGKLLSWSEDCGCTERGAESGASVSAFLLPRSGVAVVLALFHWHPSSSTRSSSSELDAPSPASAGANALAALLCAVALDASSAPEAGAPHSRSFHGSFLSSLRYSPSDMSPASLAACSSARSAALRSSMRCVPSARVARSQLWLAIGCKLSCGAIGCVPVWVLV